MKSLARRGHDDGRRHPRDRLRQGGRRRRRASWTAASSWSPARPRRCSSTPRRSAPSSSSPKSLRSRTSAAVNHRSEHGRQDQSPDHGSRRPRLPQLQHLLPRQRRTTRWSPSPRRRSPTSTTAGTRPRSPASSTRTASRSATRPSSRELIDEHDVDQVVFAYSDVAHEYVMHRSAARQRAGRRLPPASGPRHGDGQEHQAGDRRLRRAHRRRQEPDHAQDARRSCARPARRSSPSATPCPTATSSPSRPCSASPPSTTSPSTTAPSRRWRSTSRTSRPATSIYAGVDYEAILREAEKEADVILWDGGNNDFVLLRRRPATSSSPTRTAPATSLVYYPGEANLRLADVVVINKVDTADRAGIEAGSRTIRAREPDAQIIMDAPARSPWTSPS